jgi:hypothetical protein
MNDSALALPPLTDLSPNLNWDALLARLTTVLKFAERNVDLLDKHAKFWNDDVDPFVSLADKVLIETSLLVLLANRVSQPSPELHTLVNRLADRLSLLVRSEKSRVLLLRYPHTAASLGIGHIILSKLGREDKEFDLLIRDAFETGHVEAIERIPYRSMDLRWLRGLIYTEEMPDFDNLLPHSILTSTAHPIYMTAADTYALTHGLMYITDFGRMTPPASLALDRVEAITDAALACNILSENLDLLGELLMNAAILGRPWSPYARFAWHMLARTWDDLGFLPCPSFEGSVYASLTGEEASSYVFRHVYHTYYVGGILCALLLRHPEEGCANISGGTSWTGKSKVDPKLVARCEYSVRLAKDFSDGKDSENGKLDSSAWVLADSREGPDQGDLNINTLLVRIINYQASSGNAKPRWLEVLPDAQLGDNELALVLADALLIDAIREYDLATLADALIISMRLSLPISPTFIEATTFLIRQQLPCGAIGAHFVVPGNLTSIEAGRITSGLAHAIHLAATHLAHSTDYVVAY